MKKTEKNSNKYQEAWEFFVKYARNIKNDKKDLGVEYDYRISKPDMSGEFIYANDPRTLFILLKYEYYKPSPNSHSVYGKI